MADYASGTLTVPTLLLTQVEALLEKHGDGLYQDSDIVPAPCSIHDAPELVELRFHDVRWGMLNVVENSLLADHGIPFDFVCEGGAGEIEHFEHSVRIVDGKCVTTGYVGDNGYVDLSLLIDILRSNDATEREKFDRLQTIVEAKAKEVIPEPWSTQTEYVKQQATRWLINPTS